MDPSNHPDGESKTASAASPVPTPREVATTSQTQAPLTHSFHGESQDDFDLPGQPTIKLNTSIDGYVVLEKIGRGGMGVVFKAKQPGSGQLVALKMIRAGIFADHESHARFNREIAAFGQLSQLKNIVPFFHVGTYEGHAYYVMPYLARGNIGLHLKHFKANPRDAVGVVEKIARAVHRVHQEKILHRDIKPGNILLDAEGEPFLSDFGLIKHLDGDHTLTTPHQRLGTPAYMSPEQTGLLVQPIDHRTDVWALGVVLYELLTGVRPFTAPKGEETTTLLWRIAHEEPRTPRALAPGIDRNLEAVIMKCLEKQPENRFRSAEELADELKCWLDDRPMRTKPPSALAVWWRKHPIARRVIVAMCMFLPALLFAVIVYRHLADPERPLREIQREFAETGRADLMRDDWPRWSEWAFSQTEELSKAEDGSLQINATTPKLLILAKDIQCTGFILKAKVRNDVSDSEGSEVGLFVAYSAVSSDPRMPRVFYRCTFNDQHDELELYKIQGLEVPKQVEGNRLFLGHAIYGERKDGEPYYQNPHFGPAYFKPVGFRNSIWRDISITLTTKEIMGTIDDKTTTPRPMAKARMRLQTDITTSLEDLIEAPRLDDEIRISGGMGLLVVGGSASFKGVTLESIK